jgi:hypothetical protein
MDVANFVNEQKRKVDNQEKVSEVISQLMGMDNKVHNLILAHFVS